MRESDHARAPAAGGDDTPGVIARPPFIYLGGLAVGLVLHWLWPLTLSSSGYRVVAGGLALAAGLALFAAGIRAFNRAETPFKPDRPTERIITTGPFRYTRNPLYVSLTLVYVAIGLFVNSLWVLAVLVPVLAVMRYGVIAREERYLERKFGDEYRTYKARVRRWI